MTTAQNPIAPLTAIPALRQLPPATHSPPPGTSVQHVAFQSDDIFETAAVLAAQAFETLPVPSDYYRELGARFDLQADRLARFERAGVLYDRDSAGGEIFQLVN